ncbi:MAG: hypothetical protein ACOCZX_01400 [Candidatus Bipolaricaulota bacterium]
MVGSYIRGFGFRDGKIPINVRTVVDITEITPTIARIVERS